jgi:hypothetical protein
MKLNLTLSAQKTNQEVFVCILLPPQMIVTERAKLPSYAGFLSALLRLPVVLVGQGTGDFWQSFGEPRFAQRVNEIGLVRLVWRQIEIDIPNQ